MYFSYPLQSKMHSAEERWISDWGLERRFGYYTRILSISSLQKSALRGLVVSSGDLTQSLSTNALTAVKNYLDDAKSEQIVEFSRNFLAIWRDDTKMLVGKPILKVFDEFLGELT